MSELSPQSVQEVYTRIRQEIGKVMVGQDAIIRLLLASLFSRGHCLLIGVPGLAWRYLCPHGSAKAGK